MYVLVDYGRPVCSPGHLRCFAFTLRTKAIDSGIFSTRSSADLLFSSFMPLVAYLLPAPALYTMTRQACSRIRLFAEYHSTATQHRCAPYAASDNNPENFRTSSVSRPGSSRRTASGLAEGRWSATWPEGLADIFTGTKCALQLASSCGILALTLSRNRAQRVRQACSIAELLL